jgi:hypothetical protein
MFFPTSITDSATFDLILPPRSFFPSFDYRQILFPSSILILRPNFSQLRLEILRSSISFFELSLFIASWFQIRSSSTWFFELRFFPTSPQILCDPPLHSSSFGGWIWMTSRMRILDQEWRAHFIIYPMRTARSPWESVYRKEDDFVCPVMEPSPVMK